MPRQELVVAACEGLVAEHLSELLAFRRAVATPAANVVHYPLAHPANLASLAILVMWAKLVSRRCCTPSGILQARLHRVYVISIYYPASFGPNGPWQLLSFLRPFWFPVPVPNEPQRGHAVMAGRPRIPRLHCWCCCRDSQLCSKYITAGCYSNGVTNVLKAASPSSSNIVTGENGARG